MFRWAWKSITENHSLTAFSVSRPFVCSILLTLNWFRPHSEALLDPSISFAQFISVRPLTPAVKKEPAREDGPGFFGVTLASPRQRVTRIADQMSDPDAEEVMWRLALRYEMAKQAERPHRYTQPRPLPMASPVLPR